MPGCLSYIVAKDPADATTIWVTEVWEDRASHKASLSLPAVREAMAKGKPLIAKFDQSVITEPAGGHGLTPVKGRGAAEPSVALDRTAISVSRGSKSFQAARQVNFG